MSSPQQTKTPKTKTYTCDWCRASPSVSLCSSSGTIQSCWDHSFKLNGCDKDMLLVVRRIAEQWDYNENGDWTQDQEFLDGLHDPTIQGKELLSGLIDQEPELTDAQWGEVLVLLRQKFPKVSEA